MCRENWANCRELHDSSPNSHDTSLNSWFFQKREFPNSQQQVQLAPVASATAAALRQCSLLLLLPDAAVSHSVAFYPRNAEKMHASFRAHCTNLNEDRPIQSATKM